MRRLIASMPSLLRDRRGNILPMAAAGLIVLLALIGGGVDMSRAYLTKNKLQAACDAGTLAGRRAVSTNGFDSTAQAKANSYFNVNFDSANQGASNTSFVTTSSDNGNTISGTATTTLNTLTMKIFNFRTFTLTATCSASMGAGNSDVVMVLDNTGSMAYNATTGSAPRSGQTSKIQDLKTAMNNFYSTLSSATSGTNARIRYGFVPFSSSVNVGHLIYDLNPAYLADSNSYQSRTPVMQVVNQTSWGSPTTYSGNPQTGHTSDTSSTTSGSNTAYTSTSYSSLNNCQAALPASSGWVNNGSQISSTGTPYTNASGQQVIITTYDQPQTQTQYQCIKNTGNKKYYRWSYPAYRDLYTYSYTTQNPITTQAQTFDHWSFQPVVYDTSSFKAFNSVNTNTGTGSYPATVSSIWNGCIEERQTSPASSFSYSAISGISPHTWDLDIDTPPDPSNDNSKWAPMWPQVEFWRYTSGGSTTTANSLYGYGRTSGVQSTTGMSVYDYDQSQGVAGYVACPAQAHLLSTMTQSDFSNYANSLTPIGGTYLDIGLLWGARLSSPDGIFSSNVNDQPNNGGEVSRHIILMTDGMMDTNNNSVTAYGMEYWDRMVTTDGAKSTSDSNHSARFRALCDAVKDKGIRIWVIAFGSGSSLNSDLTYCASSNSAYAASDGAALDSAFQDIAHQVGELRIIQ